MCNDDFASLGSYLTVMRVELAKFSKDRSIVSTRHLGNVNAAQDPLAFFCDGTMNIYVSWSETGKGGNDT